MQVYNRFKTIDAGRTGRTDRNLVPEDGCETWLVDNTGENAAGMLQLVGLTILTIDLNNVFLRMG